MTEIEDIKIKQYYSPGDVDFFEGDDEDESYWSFYDSVACLIEKVTNVQGLSNYGFESGFDAFIGKNKTYNYDSESGAFCAYLKSEDEVKEFVNDLNRYITKVIGDLNILTNNV
jgi:hypothetical protein